MSRPKLSDAEVQSHLARLPEWKLVEGSLDKTYQFSDFGGSLRFVNHVAADAEAANHHPDILIRYDKVTLTLTTHDAGGLTLSDVELAAMADDIAGQIDK